jgi:ketosteroid isomerase-like protein
MSEESRDLITRGVAAFNRRDLDGMLATLHPDVELVPLRAVLEGTVYRGHEGLRRWLDDMADDWRDFGIEVIGVRELDGDRVILEAEVHAHGRASGVALDAPGAWLCEIRDGRVATIRFYGDVEAALEAAEGPDT